MNIYKPENRKIERIIENVLEEIVQSATQEITRKLKKAFRVELIKELKNYGLSYQEIADYLGNITRQGVHSIINQ